MTRTLLSATPLCTAAILTSSSALAGELVFNGGFETGDYDGWDVPPYVPGQGPDSQIFGVAADGGHSGLHYAGLSSAQLRFISQTLPTTAGQDYELTFWMRRPDNLPGLFQVRWQGQIVYSSSSPLPDGINWHRFSFPLHANFNGSFIEFGQRAFPLYYHIDDISVVPIPAPSAAATLGMTGLLTLGRRPRRGAQ